MDSVGKTEVCVLKYTSLSRYLTVQWIYPFKVLSGLVLLTRFRSLWKDELMGNGGNEQPILCGFRSFMWESESQLNANYVSQAFNHEVIQKHRGCSVTPASELHCMKDEEETGQRLGRNVKGRQRKQMGSLSQIITHASGPGVCECCSAGIFYSGFLWSILSSLWPAGDLSSPSVPQATWCAG